MDKVIDSTHGRFFIREYCNDDEQNVLELWEAAFGKKLSLDIWRWKFCRNPFGRQIMLCVNEQSKPVAMYSGIPYSANWKGKQVTFTQLIDNMSHPEYRFTVSRKKGLYALTVEKFVEKFGHSEGSIMSYGFSGEKHYRFGKRSGIKEKRMGQSSASLLLINSIAPYLFSYGSARDISPLCMRSMELLENIEGEDNHEIRMWKSLGIKAVNALESQALIQLKRNYCDQKRCLECRIGLKILDKNTIK